MSLVGQIYDPLGFLSPVTVRLKILLQELCKIKIGWDQQLEGILLERWKKLVRELRGSPFLLNATLRHHVEKYHTSHPELVNILTESTYVDDVIFGADTEAEAYEPLPEM